MYSIYIDRNKCIVYIYTSFAVQLQKGITVSQICNCNFKSSSFVLVKVRERHLNFVIKRKKTEKINQDLLIRFIHSTVKLSFSRCLFKGQITSRTQTQHPSEYQLCTTVHIPNTPHQQQQLYSL